MIKLIKQLFCKKHRFYQTHLVTGSTGEPMKAILECKYCGKLDYRKPKLRRREVQNERNRS